MNSVSEVQLTVCRQRTETWKHVRQLDVLQLRQFKKSVAQTAGVLAILNLSPIRHQKDNWRGTATTTFLDHVANRSQNLSPHLT